MRAILGAVAVSLACSSSPRPCAAADFSCPGANEVCNPQTLQCEAHESCAVDAGAGLATSGRCDNPARPRCADILVPQASGDPVYQLRCAEASGTPKGAACAVSFQDGPTQFDGTTAKFETGRDSCADGLTCAGPAGASGTCMKVCAADAECEAAEVCATYHPVSQERGALFNSGLCVPKCTGPFDPGCGGACLPVGADFGCVPAGAAAAGRPCRSRLSACAPGAACVGLMMGHFIEAICTQICDASHPCPAGGTCAMTFSNAGTCH